MSWFWRNTLCKWFGHRKGWYPTAPWECERCGANFYEEWKARQK